MAEAVVAEMMGAVLNTAITAAISVNLHLLVMAFPPSEVFAARKCG
jgi:hypothetical protein